MLPSYPDCPRRSAAKYWPHILREFGFDDIRQLEPGIGAAVGTGAHAAARVLMEAKRDQVAIEKVDQVVEIAIETFRNETAQGVIFDEITPAKNDGEAQIRDLFQSFRFEVAPAIDPEFVETRRKAQRGDELLLTGQADVETRTNEIADWKFGSRFPIAQAQLGGYSVLRRSAGAPRAALLATWHLPRTKRGRSYPGAKVRRYSVDYCEKTAFATMARIQKDFANFMTAKDPFCFPANPMSVLCSDKFCPAWGTSFCQAARYE